MNELYDNHHQLFVIFALPTLWTQRWSCKKAICPPLRSVNTDKSNEIPSWEEIIYNDSVFADIYIMWLVPILISSQVILSLSAPATDSSSSFRSKSGVTLNGRKKVHGEGEKCPSELTHYCKCRARGEGLDITCEKVNSDQLHVRLHFGEKILF